MYVVVINVTGACISLLGKIYMHLCEINDIIEDVQELSMWISLSMPWPDVQYEYFSGRSNSSSSEASTPEAGTPDCRQPPPLLRTISEGTYTTIDSLSSTSSFSKSDMPVFDPQEAVIDDTCWDLKQRLSLEALKSSWKDESVDRVDSANLRLKDESIKNCASIPNPAPYPNPQSSSVSGDVECTQLWFV